MHLESSQPSKMEAFAEMVSDIQPSAIFAENLIVTVLLDSKYASAQI